MRTGYNSELAHVKKELEGIKKAAAEAKKSWQHEKRQAEQAAVAKKREVDAELVTAKKQIKELTASRDKLREGLTPLLSTVKQLREQGGENRAAVAEMDGQLTADLKAIDNVIKTHTLKSGGGEELLKEHDEEIMAMRKDQRRVEREVRPCLRLSAIAGCHGGSLKP